jgi:hypothetical protein
MGDLKDIMDWIRSGTLSKYLSKFKTLMAEVKRQPDKATKLFTLGFGLMDLLNKED